MHRTLRLEVDESKRLALDDDGEADLVREGVREGVDGGGARGDLGVEQAPPLVSPGFRIVGVEMVGVVGVRVFVFGGKRRRDLRCGGFPRVARGGGGHQPGGHGEPAREPPERGHLSPELSRLRRGQVAGRPTRAGGGRCAARCPCRGRLGLVLLRLGPRPRVGGVLDALQDLRALLVALPPGELERGADRPRGILQVLARVVEPCFGLRTCSPPGVAGACDRPPPSPHPQTSRSLHSNAMRRRADSALPDPRAVVV